MNQLLITYPGKARTYPIGETKGHSMLYVIELSDSLENSHLKPAIKVCVEVIFTHNIMQGLCFDFMTLAELGMSRKN